MKKLLFLCLAFSAFVHGQEGVYTFENTEYPELVTFDVDAQIVTIRRAGEPDIVTTATSGWHQSLTEEERDGGIRIEYVYKQHRYSGAYYEATVNTNAEWAHPEAHWLKLSRHTGPVYEGLVLAGEPEPPAPMEFTKAQLQILGGVIELEEENQTITVEWAEMEDGETITITSQGTPPQIDGLTPASSSLLLRYPASLEDHRPIIQSATGNFFFRKIPEDEALLVPSDGVPWEYGLVEGDTLQAAGSVVGEFFEDIYIAFAGTVCTRVEYGGTIIVRTPQWEPCDSGAIPLPTVDFLDGIWNARATLGGDRGWTIPPEHFVFILRGDDAPKGCQNYQGIITCGWNFLAHTLDIPRRKSTGTHEMCHTQQFKWANEGASTLFALRRNWPTESSATWCEGIVPNCPTCWLAGLNHTFHDVTLGLDCAIHRTHYQLYQQSWAFFYADHYFAGWDLPAMYRNENANHLYGKRCIEVWMNVLGLDYEGLRRQYASMAHHYLKDEVPSVEGVYGVPEPFMATLDSSPKSVPVGQMIRYQSGSNKTWGCLRWESDADINTDVSLTFSYADQKGWGWFYDGFGSGEQVILLNTQTTASNRTPVDWYVVVSSVEGHDPSEPIPEITLSVEPINTVPWEQFVQIRDPQPGECN